MTSSHDLVPCKAPPSPIKLVSLGPESRELIYSTYFRITTPPTYWISRLTWSPQQWDDHLNDSKLQVWMPYIDNEPAGLAEIVTHGDGNCEIQLFGLIPELIGKGYGSHFLAQIVELAWTSKQANRSDTQRVWLHTSTLDHPHALSNYITRGFRVYNEVLNQKEVPNYSAGR